MGERSMKECVEEQLIVLQGAARAASVSICGFTLQDWYDDGAILKYLSCWDDSEDDDVTYAWGYLSGAADAADMTVRDYIESFGLSFNEDDDSEVGSASVRAYRDSGIKAMLGTAATPKKPRRKAKRK